jgi:Cu+-exporting ATPase
MLESRTLGIAGMTCALCSIEIERALFALPGVESASVSYAAERASLRFDGERVSPADIDRAISRLGFEPSAPTGASRLMAEERRIVSLRRSLIAAAILSFPLFFMMIITGFQGCHAAFDPLSQSNWGKLSVYLSYRFRFLHDWRFQTILVTPILFVIGRGFYRNAWRSIRLGVPTMDLLVVLGATSSFVYSLYVAIDQSWSIYNHPKLYFEAGSTVVTLVLLGKYLEALAKRRARRALDSLAALSPPTAIRVEAGEEREVPLALLAVGDELVLRPGALVPADGVVESGCSEVDESMLTGEAEPVLKEAGSQVLAGSLNRTGALRIKVDRLGGDTRLAGILRFVEEAQASKASVQLFVDRACAVFVPIVLAAAAATFALWFFVAYRGSLLLVDQAIVKAVSVLVVACPCALGLATPAALVVGMGAAARRGILFKDGQAVEALSKVDLIAFDKTGTLTLGRPTLAHVLPFGHLVKHEVHQLAAIAERQSEQPYGRALCEAYCAHPARLPFPERFEARPGKGVVATVAGREILVGRPRFLVECGVDTAEAEGEIAMLRETGRSVVALAVDGRLEGLFALSDEPRPEAARTVKTLAGLGIGSLVVSGDELAAATTAAQAIGISRVEAQLSPEGKAELVGRLEAEGRRVAMVGDGINDAPALAAASVGVAIGGGSDAALEAGDVVLLGRDLSALPAAVILARRTAARIRLNLIWAFAYNVICIGFAAAGALSPELSALAMTASSLTVLVGSLGIGSRLPGQEPKEDQPVRTELVGLLEARS